jgi:hypothetical protein
MLLVAVTVLACYLETSECTPLSAVSQPINVASPWKELQSDGQNSAYCVCPQMSCCKADDDDDDDDE